MTLAGADLNLACAWALVDGLVAGGVRHACVSPGARSASLALALARHPAIELQVHLDERSGGFAALGIASATGAPVALACTSGTAAAGYLPAIVEASQSRLPLVALTADRPPRLRGTGANQTIDQLGLYGGYVREALDLPVPEAAGQEAWWRQAAREALEAAAGDPVGPVHVNCPFEEPLGPSGDLELPPPSGERLDMPARPAAELTIEEADRLAHLVSGARGAVVVGGTSDDEAEGAAFWSKALGWPLLAEPTSGVRTPELALAAGQALLADTAWADAHRAEVVIQLGATPTTRATQAFVAAAERVIVADRRHPDPDPERQAAWRIAVDPGALAHALHDRTVADESPGDEVDGEAAAQTHGTIGQAWRLVRPPAAWTGGWRAADAAARDALDGVLDAIEDPFEPRVARDLAAWMPDDGTLFVGNSSPVRDLDLAMAPRRGLRVLANRGASGIDGLLSTTIGIAAATRPVVALIGDLSFLHDLGALAWNARRGATATAVVVHNGGGEIFASLPQRGLPEFRDLFITPHDADLAALTTASGAGHARVDRAGDLVPALEAAHDAGGLQVVEVVVDAARALEHRAAMRQAVASALI